MKTTWLPGIQVFVKIKGSKDRRVDKVCHSTTVGNRGHCGTRESKEGRRSPVKKSQRESLRRWRWTRNFQLVRVLSQDLEEKKIKYERKSF